MSFDPEEVISFLAHSGVKGMHWGVRQQRTSDAEVHSQRIMEGRRSAAASRAGTATSPRQATAIRKSSSGKPLRPAPPPKNATREQALIAKAAQQGYDRAASPATVRYFNNAPARRASADPKVNDLLIRVMSQGANRVEAAAGKAFIDGLPPGIKLR